MASTTLENGLSDSINSLICKIDNALGNAHTIQMQNYNEQTSNMTQSCFNQSPPHSVEVLGEPAAFEEVAYGGYEHQSSVSSKTSTITSKSTVWDVQDKDISSYLEKLEHMKSLEAQDDRISIVSNISSFSSLIEDEVSDISSGAINDVKCYSAPHVVFPYSKLEGSPFQLFNIDMLDRSTKYSHNFNSSKRQAAYYGEHPYSYGNSSHPCRPYSENPYLEKILSYIEIVIPGIKFNSAMVHKYETGKAFMPFHSDDEEEILDGSTIVTISFGASRFIEFKNKASGSIVCQKLDHGDVFVMDKQSQSHFMHSIPPDTNSDLTTRISITLRHISAPKDIAIDTYSLVSSVTATSPTTTVTSFLLNLQHEDNEHDNGDKSFSVPVPESGLADPPGYFLSSDESDQEYQPKLLDDIHPSRRVTLNTYESVIQVPKQLEHALFISSSMFRNIDTDRLSSKDITASKLFYPGADAVRMLENIKSDPKFTSIQKDSISKVFILTGSNNIDNIYLKKNNASVNKSVADIKRLLEFLKSSLPSATINIINILPRKSVDRCHIISHLNSNIEVFCKTQARINYIDTYSNYMFSNSDGSRRNNFFMPGGYYGNDNVHLNAIGVVRLGKHLKFLAHQN